jgi:hypothetical protein
MMVPFPRNLLRSLVCATLIIASVTSQAQDAPTPNAALAASARAELDSVIAHAMTTTNWRKVRMHRKGRRMVLVGKTGTTKVKRTFKAKASGTLERVLIEPWSSGPRDMDATFVDGQLIYAQWTMVKQEGGFKVPYEKTYINGKLHILRVYDKDGVATNRTELLPP